MLSTWTSLKCFCSVKCKNLHVHTFLCSEKDTNESDFKAYLEYLFLQSDLHLHLYCIRINSRKVALHFQMFEEGSL